MRFTVLFLLGLSLGCTAEKPQMLPLSGPDGASTAGAMAPAAPASCPYVQLFCERVQPCYSACNMVFAQNRHSSQSIRVTYAWAQQTKNITVPAGQRRHIGYGNDFCQFSARIIKCQ